MAGTGKSKSFGDRAEWKVRTDLAAAYQIAERQGFNEGIHNHFTATIPGVDHAFLVLPYGMHWSEVTASSLLLIDYDGEVLGGEGSVERSAVCIHGAVHQAIPEAACVLHTHMPYASSLSRIEGFRLEPTGQTEIGLLDQIAYDDHYSGVAYAKSEGERLAKVLGKKKILIMANHGVLVTGATIAQAYNRLYYLERACRAYLFALWTGRPLRRVPESMVRKTVAQFAESSNSGGDKGMGSAELHFAALKRMLERERPPDYRT